MKLENKIAIGFGALSLVGIGAFGLAEKSAEIYRTGCETYQGYRDNSADGERTFIFDEQTLKEREDGPNYALLGNPRMYKNLEIGNKYTLEIKEPVLSVFPEKLLSFGNCE